MKVNSEVFLRGTVRHMVRIGQHEEHKALRARNEARLAAIKADGKLVEEVKGENYHINRTWSIVGGC